MSRHLKVLRDAGLVDRKTAGPSRIYFARPGAVERVCAWTMRHRDFWEASLRRLEQALMQEVNRR